MTLIREDGLHEIWTRALEDAAGLIAAYLVPERHPLERVEVTSGADSTEDAFYPEIRRRLEFGRAWAITEAVEHLTGAVSTSIRHVLYYEKEEVRGALHFPRYLQVLAQNPSRGIPVIRAARHPATPENLLIAEALGRALTISRSWTAGTSAEARTARELHSRLQRVEARRPWSDLRVTPRPPLNDLLKSVRARMAAGAVPRKPVSRVVDLLSATSGQESAFRAAASVLSFPVTRDPGFQDKLFELLCLAWILQALRSDDANEVVVTPTQLVGAQRNQVPLFNRTRGQETIEVYFQNGKQVPTRHWSYQGNQPLGAIFDVICKINVNGTSKTLILDAKNRGLGNSEVAYKLLGYKENTHEGAQPFLAAAIFPLPEGDSAKWECLARGNHRIWLIRVPLTANKGRESMAKLFRKVIESA